MNPCPTAGCERTWTPCVGHTSACTGGPTSVYGHGVYRVEPVALCAACVAVLTRLGFPLEPERRKSGRREAA